MMGIDYFDVETCDIIAGVSGASEGGPLTGVRFPEVADKAMLASSIKSYIQKGWPKSPLIEYSEKYVSYGEQYNVNPLIGVIISQVEYQFGTARTDLVGPGGPGQYNYWAVTHNSNSQTRFGAYTSIDEAMEAHFKLLSGKLYLGPPSNFTNIKQIMNRYAPAFENNTAGYIDTIIKGMKKIVEDGGVDSSTPTSDDSGEETDEVTANGCQCANQDPSAATSTSGTSLNKDFLKDLANTHGGKTSISVESVDGSIKANSGGDTKMPARSTYKLYTAYATLKAIEAGKISWGTNIWSGNSVEKTMEAMIVKSNNDASAALRMNNTIGSPSVVTKLLQNEVGLSKDTIMGSGSAGNAAGSNSVSTANDFTKFLVMLHKKSLPGVKEDSSYDKLLSFMKRATTDGGSARAGIAAGVNGSAVADKAGWAGPGVDPASNDVGIVYLEKKPYTIAILSDKPNQWQGIATIAENVHSAMSNQADDICSGESNTSDLPSTIKSYAWPNYHKAPYHQRKPAYAEAVTKASKGGLYVGGSVNGVAGIDCGGFVTLAVRNSGYDPGYNYDGKGGNTISQKKWLDANWTKVTISSTGDLQPGDVAMSSSHTFLHVGKIDGFNDIFASASYSTSGNGRAPMAGQGDAMSPGKWTWYRKK